MLYFQNRWRLMLRFFWKHTHTHTGVHGYEIGCFQSFPESCFFKIIREKKKCVYRERDTRTVGEWGVDIFSDRKNTDIPRTEIKKKQNALLIVAVVVAVRLNKQHEHWTFCFVNGYIFFRFSSNLTCRSAAICTEQNEQKKEKKIRSTPKKKKPTTSSMNRVIKTWRNGEWTKAGCYTHTHIVHFDSFILSCRMWAVRLAVISMRTYRDCGKTV